MPPDEPDRLPPANALIGLEVPAECLPGVLVAMDGLREHLRNLEGFALPEASE